MYEIHIHIRELIEWFKMVSLSFIWSEMITSVRIGYSLCLYYNISQNLNLMNIHHIYIIIIKKFFFRIKSLINKGLNFSEVYLGSRSV